MISVKTNGKISFPQLKFVEELEEIANKICIKILKYNIDQEQSLTEDKYPELAPSKIKSKLRQGLSTKVLTATGRLRNSFFTRRKDKNSVVITLNADRKQIGNYLQNEGIKSKKFGKRYFNFFGVSTRMEQEAMKFMKNKVKEYVDNARSK